MLLHTPVFLALGRMMQVLWNECEGNLDYTEFRARLKIIARSCHFQGKIKIKFHDKIKE